MNRLKNLPTLRVNTSEKVSVTYRGKQYEGFKGDTVASLLYANGIRIFGRSLKYHRPRGLYSLDGECSNTCMQIDDIPNERAENIPARDGMNIREQNVKGSAEKDMMGFIDKLDWAMPAGFYYHTMHRPAKMWPVAMKQIRKAAGLGTLNQNFNRHERFDEIFPKTEVCVIGGGPAGMAAALEAADKGVRVILLESRPWLGGFYEYRTSVDESGNFLYSKARTLAEKVEAHPDIRVFKHTFMVGAYNNNLITAFQRGGETESFHERYIEIRAQSVVVATGCIERPLIFENNERPGVMQAGCAHRLCRTYGILPGKAAVFSIGHDTGLEAAVDLFDMGLKIACIADLREDGQDPELLEKVKGRKIPYYPGRVATEALGKKRVTGVKVGTIDGTVEETYTCDLVVASAGFTPVTGPITINQGKLKFDEHTGFFLPSVLPDKTHVAGRINGLGNPASIEASGKLAGLRAAAECGKDLTGEIDEAQGELNDLPGPQRGSKFVTGPVSGRKSYICFDEDTTIKNIKQAIRKGFDVPELIKRYTSAGTGPGQGGIPGHNLPLFTAKFKAEENEKIRPTNQRPPLVPLFLSTYAGTNHDMAKRTPMHDRQKKDGGIFRRLGVWRRARYFSNDFSCRKEIENVRNNVGILDGSTLGKFRIHGPDALKALQRVYISNMEKVKQGRVKYTAMCNDDGCVIDDGVITKLAENDYFFTTSTGRAGSTVEWIRYHTRFDGWDFNLVNLTDALGVINLSGPNSRKVIEKVTDQDISDQALPFSGVKEYTISDDIPVTVMRLGFVGELSYELHVPSSYMESAWDLLLEAGKEFHIKNFGVEAQNVLRMEKGHVILGQESEQRTNLTDINMGFLWYRKKKEAKTVGNVALEQTVNDTGRLKLVGIKMKDPSRAPGDGCVIVDDTRVRGYVCTIRKSFSVEGVIGMALVEQPLAKNGTTVFVYEDECKGNLSEAQVVPMPFYDPEGKRMKA